MCENCPGLTDAIDYALDHNEFVILDLGDQGICVVPDTLVLEYEAEGREWPPTRAVTRGDGRSALMYAVPKEMIPTLIGDRT